MFSRVIAVQLWADGRGWRFGSSFWLMWVVWWLQHRLHIESWRGGEWLMAMCRIWLVVGRPGRRIARIDENAILAENGCFVSYLKICPCKVAQIEHVDSHRQA